MIKCEICGKEKDEKFFRKINMFKISYICIKCNRKRMEEQRKIWEEEIMRKIENFREED